jgi:hypothetical protein
VYYVIQMQYIEHLFNVEVTTVYASGSMQTVILVQIMWNVCRSARRARVESMFSFYIVACLSNFLSRCHFSFPGKITPVTFPFLEMRLSKRSPSSIRDSGSLILVDHLQLQGALSMPISPVFLVQHLLRSASLPKSTHLRSVS